MGQVRFEISMSLDGYVTAADPSPEKPMGDGGEVLREWAGHATTPPLAILSSDRTASAVRCLRVFTAVTYSSTD